MFGITFDDFNMVLFLILLVTCLILKWHHTNSESVLLRELKTLSSLLQNIQTTGAQLNRY